MSNPGLPTSEEDSRSGDRKDYLVGHQGSKESDHWPRHALQRF